MSITRCADIAAARWIEQRPEDWWRLAVRGPVCFDRYARLRTIPDPSYPGQPETDVHVDVPEDNDQIGIVLAALAPYTDTPEDCYFLVWEGWPSFHTEYSSPRVSIPNRGYFHFHGSLADFADWNTQVEALLGDTAPPPAFVWPADRAWCVTFDVDPHFATIGGSAEVIAATLALTDVDVVADDPDIEPPYYH
ncbi:hypothetical protein L1080_033600 [Rhodococcus sp. MSC1_016]|uniref:hypothetical protein n=1 Tax=Rhodococcus sp. MSC1_016 TaxID=2909266 RepID=UPI00203096E3|nr:hypothetical protein [Rhodococcus sp. MSC1_016]